MKNKKIIITGGLGFIGSNIAERLVKENEILIIDDESTGYLNNIKNFEMNINLVRGSISKLDLVNIFEGYDYVLHQAAIPSVPRSVNDPISTNEAGITGTLKVLKAAHDAGIKKVVFASSSSVYGDTPVLPKKEDMPLNPLSPYAVTKATGELYCKVFQEIYGLPTVALRYFNVFGPRQDPNSQYAAVIPKFIMAILKNESPIVYGDGVQSRDFTFVQNVVNANILACESDKIGVFNIACGKRITINQLIDNINEILGKDIKPTYINSRPGDIKHSLADISKARSIGYNPGGDFKEELSETVGWFKDVFESN
jgi:UDP-glucose 4-epimerase